MAKSDFLDEKTKNRIKNEVYKFNTLMGIRRRRKIVEEEIAKLDPSSLEYKEKVYELDLLNEPGDILKAKQQEENKIQNPYVGIDFNNINDSIGDNASQIHDDFVSRRKQFKDMENEQRIFNEEYSKNLAQPKNQTDIERIKKELRKGATEYVKSLSDKEVIELLPAINSRIEQLKKNTKKKIKYDELLSESENGDGRLLLESQMVKRRLENRAKKINQETSINEHDIEKENVKTDELNIQSENSSNRTIRGNSVDEIDGMRELFDETGITNAINNAFIDNEEIKNQNPNLIIKMGNKDEKITENKEVEETNTNKKRIDSLNEEIEQYKLEADVAQQEINKIADSILTNKNQAAQKDNSNNFQPTRKEQITLTSIVFDAKSCKYIFEAKRKDDDFDIEEKQIKISNSKIWSNPKRKQSYVKDRVNYFTAESIFKGINNETVKKCDPNLLILLYRYYDYRGNATEGINAANKYLKALQGESKDLGFHLVYKLQEIDKGVDKDNNLIRFWDKIRLLKMAKKQEHKDIIVYPPDKIQNSEKKKLTLWKRIALGFSSAAMAITGISLTAAKGNKMLNEGKDRNNSYVDDISLENDRIETGTVTTTQTKATETQKTTVTTIQTKESTTKSTTKETTTVENKDNNHQQEKNDFLEGIKYNPEENLTNSNETVSFENEVESMSLGSVLKKLPKGLEFTEGMDGGRVGKVGSSATPANGFYVIDRVVAVEDNAIDYHSGLNGNKISDNATAVHISYIQGARTMEEAIKIVSANKNNKNWNSNGILQRGWVKADTLKKIYEEQNKVKMYVSEKGNMER